MVNVSRRFLIYTAAMVGFVRAARADNVIVQAPAPSSVSFCFGAALPLTGIYALQGDEVLRGVQLAIDEVNASGGVAGNSITLAVGNMPAQGDAAATVNHLISDKNANILFGSGSSVLSYPATAAAELAQTPFIELTAPADGIVSRGFKFLLRTGPDSSMTGQLAAATVKTRYPKKRLGLLFNTGATAGALAGAALAALKSEGQEVTLSIAYPEDAADLSAQAGRMMRAGVEILLHAAGPDDTLALFQALQNLNWRPKALIGCGAGYGLRDTQRALGSALDGTLVIAAPFYPDRAALIAKAYESKYAVPPRSAESCTAYVGAKLVFETLSNVSGDPSKLLEALRRLSLPRGTLANGFGAAFDESGQNKASFVTLQTWRGGGLVPA